MKREEKLFEALGEIDDELLLESEKRRKKKRLWLWIPAAACICLAAVGSINHGWGKDIPAKVDLSAALPMLTISEGVDSMGFEGYMAYDISELVNGNPWSESADISHLPVYRNRLTYNEYGQAEGGDVDQMQAFMLEIADRLGMSFTITDDTPDEKTQKNITDKFASIGESVPEGYFTPSKLIGTDKGMTLEVDASMTAKISFDPAVSLPGAYNFSHFASYKEVSAVAEYLEEEYRDLIAIDNPRRNIYGGDYTIHQQQMYHIEFFDGSGDLTDQIINYNFNRVAFYCDDEGKLFLARVFQPDLSEVVGNYPIISSEEALALLRNGNYITSVPWEMPGEEYVQKVELIYRAEKALAYYMPYYRFYVELPDAEEENGLLTYGAYYVPAVSPEYLTNMPTWDGNFN